MSTGVTPQAGSRGGFKTRFPAPGGFKRKFLRASDEFKTISVAGGGTRVPAALLRRRSERVYVGGEIGDRRSQRRSARRQAETFQDSRCRIWRMNRSQNVHSAAAAFTLKNIHHIVALGEEGSITRP